MKLIDPSVEIIPQEDGILGVYKQIEKAGRTCYKSEDKITETSSGEFVKRMIDSGHTAMLEHGSIYLMVPLSIDTSILKLADNKYTKTSFINDSVYITTNYRVLIENNWLNYLKYTVESPSLFRECRVTARFICDRGVSHELVRHRVFSFAQESTRQWRH